MKSPAPASPSSSAGLLPVGAGLDDAGEGAPEALVTVEPPRNEQPPCWALPLPLGFPSPKAHSHRAASTVERWTRETNPPCKGRSSRLRRRTAGRREVHRPFEALQADFERPAVAVASELPREECLA